MYREFVARDASTPKAMADRASAYNRLAIIDAAYVSQAKSEEHALQVA